MKTLKTICEGILRGEEATIENGEHEAILSMLFGSADERKELRNMLYIDVTNTEQRCKYANNFKEDKIYIKFMTNSVHNKYYGFIIGPWTRMKRDELVAMPDCKYNPRITVVNMRELKMDMFINKNEAYELPEKWHWLYYDAIKRLNK